MSYEFVTTSISGNPECIQIGTSSPVNSNTLTYVPYISPIIPADTILSPVNSNVVYTGVQVSSPLVNSVPYSILGTTSPVTPNIYNLGAGTTQYNYVNNYSVFQVISSVNNQSNSSVLNCSGSGNESILNCSGSGNELCDRYSIVGYNCSPTTKPCGRNNKAGWYDIHAKHVSMVMRRRAGVILCGDSIIAGLSRYSGVWGKYFRPLNAINCGIGGDRTQHVLWRMENMELPATVKFIVLHCGTNNIDRDPPHEIANGVVSCGLVLQEKVPGLNIVITGLLPRDLENSRRRSKIIQTNKCIKRYCQQFSNFTYMSQDKDWVLENGLLNEQLYYDDHLHLIESGNHKFAASITNIIGKLSNNEDIVYSCDESESESESSSNMFVMRHGEARVEETPSREGSVYETPVKKKRKRLSPSGSPGSPVVSSKKRVKTDNYTYFTKEQSNNEGYLCEDGTPDLCEDGTPDLCEDGTPNHNLKKIISEERTSSVKELSHFMEETNPLNIEKGKYTDEHLTGTVKSIDISLADTERQEARKNKFGDNLLKNMSDAPKKSPRSSKASKISAPSALVQKIRRSMQQAREELSKKKLALTSSAPMSSQVVSGDSSPKEPIDSNIKMRKILSDYGSGSDSE